MMVSTHIRYIIIIITGLLWPLKYPFIFYLKYYHPLFLFLFVSFALNSVSKLLFLPT